MNIKLYFKQSWQLMQQSLLLGYLYRRERIGHLHDHGIGSYLPYPHCRHCAGGEPQPLGLLGERFVYI